MEQPTILMVMENGDVWSDLLEKVLSRKIHLEESAGVVIQSIDPLEYQVAIIDASDDVFIDGQYLLSERLKHKNPTLYIIGISYLGAHFLSNPNKATQMYDRKLSMIPGEGLRFAYKIKEALEEIGFLI